MSKNCTPLWRSAHFQKKNVQTTSASDHFPMSKNCEKHIFKWKCAKNISIGPLFEVPMSKKLHAAVAISTFASESLQNTSASDHMLNFRCRKTARSTFSTEHVQNTSASDHFLKFRCRKIARRCGEKRIFNWKRTKKISLGPLFEVPMSKNCTPLWREAYIHLKMLEKKKSRSTFWSSDVENSHAAVRSNFKWKMYKHVSFGLWRKAHFQLKMLVMKARARKGSGMAMRMSVRRNGTNASRWWCGMMVVTVMLVMMA